MNPKINIKILMIIILLSLWIKGKRIKKEKRKYIFTVQTGYFNESVSEIHFVYKTDYSFLYYIKKTNQYYSAYYQPSKKKEQWPVIKTLCLHL